MLLHHTPLILNSLNIGCTFHVFTQASSTQGGATSHHPLAPSTLEPPPHWTPAPSCPPPVLWSHAAETARPNARKGAEAIAAALEPQPLVRPGRCSLGTPLCSF